MFRIFGRPLNGEYKLLRGLSRIYGVGKSRAGNLIGDLGLSPDMPIKKLTPVQKKEITDWLKARGISPSEIKKDRRDSERHLNNKKLQ